MKVDETKYKKITRNLENDYYDYTLIRFRNRSDCKRFERKLKSIKEWFYTNTDKKGHIKMIIIASTHSKILFTPQDQRGIINQYSILP